MIMPESEKVEEVCVTLDKFSRIMNAMEDEEILLMLQSEAKPTLLQSLTKLAASSAEFLHRCRQVSEQNHIPVGFPTGKSVH